MNIYKKITKYIPFILVVILFNGCIQFIFDTTPPFIKFKNSNIVRVKDEQNYINEETYYLYYSDKEILEVEGKIYDENGIKRFEKDRTQVTITDDMFSESFNVLEGSFQLRAEDYYGNIRVVNIEAVRDITAPIINSVWINNQIIVEAGERVQGNIYIGEADEYIVRVQAYDLTGSLNDVYINRELATLVNKEYIYSIKNFEAVSGAVTQKNFSVIASDRAGNSVPEMYTFYVDVKEPEIIYSFKDLLPDDDGIFYSNQEKISLEVTYSDESGELSQKKVFIGNENKIVFEEIININDDIKLANGENIFYFIAEDIFGNISTESAIVIYS